MGKVDVWLWPPAELRSAVSTERGMYQTTQFEPGASDSSCNDDGSAWNVAKVVCPFARSTHESLVNVAKNACSSLAKLNGCWLYSRGHCKLAAKARKKPFACRNFTGYSTTYWLFWKQKVQDQVQQEGGAKGKWPICEQV